MSLQTKKQKLRGEPDMMGLRYHYASLKFNLKLLYTEPKRIQNPHEINYWGLWRLACNLVDKGYNLSDIINVLEQK